MKTTTKPVITSVQFDENDIVVDNQWYSVGIRRWIGGEHGYLWLVTPDAPAANGLTLTTYTDEEMKKFIMDHKFTFVGGYHDLHDNAPKVG